HFRCDGARSQARLVPMLINRQRGRLGYTWACGIAHSGGGSMVSFTLNNRQVSVDADPSTPLLWAIRDHVGLTGTKYGCGAGLCGACTIHVDGTAQRS